MKRRTLLSTLALMGMSPVLANAQTADVPTDLPVIRLEQPIPQAEGTLIKIWSYACAFCFRFERGVDPELIPLVRKETALQFHTIHLSTKGQYGKVATPILAGLVAHDQRQGRCLDDEDSAFKKAKMAWYEATHYEEATWATEKDFVQVAADATGLSQDELQQLARTEDAQQKAKRWDAVAYRIAQIQGVPAYVVNGKYLIETAKIQSVKHMLSVIERASKLP